VWNQESETCDLGLKLVRFVRESNEAHLGLVLGDEVVDLGFENPIALLIEAVAWGESEEDYLRSVFDLERLRRYPYSDSDENTQRSLGLSIPLPPPEVWGCGITYTRSRAARETETAVKGVYDHVYDAERPEVFFKATGHRCVGPNGCVCIRSDSEWTVPEPELAVILGAEGKALGYTVGNDVSARDIERENPLYLPQAKIYEASCSLGPAIVTPKSLGNAKDLKIAMSILRGEEVVFREETNTSLMKRDPEELMKFLVRDNPVPVGSVCLTGTGIVPPDDFTLDDGDVTEIWIENIGTLRNRVKQLKR